MTLKKIISCAALAATFLSMPVRAGKINFQPMYGDARFAPADKFHAGCLQEAQVMFQGTEKNISKIHVELVYDPEAIEISRVLGADQMVANYRMEYDRIVFDIDNPILDTDTPLFHMAFKGNESTQASDLWVATGSYFVTNGKIVYLNQRFSLQFAQVPECDPDVIPPSVNLIFPENPAERISLDQYFIFEIKDNGKGIDLNNVKIFLNDKLYTADSANLKRKGNYLTFYPQDWLGINQNVVVQISVSDLQSYGGANITDKVFNFKTATGMALIDNIDPMTFRTIAREGSQTAGTAEECLTLQNLYVTSDASFQNNLLPVLAKLGCDTSDLSNGDLFEESHAAAEDKTSKLDFISVFAALGWILFIIALILKFHYLASYKKQKRIIKNINK